MWLVSVRRHIGFLIIITYLAFFVVLSLNKASFKYIKYTPYEPNVLLLDCMPL